MERSGFWSSGEGSDVEYYYCGMAYYQLFVLDGSTGKNGDLALQRLKQAMAVGGSDSSMGGTCWYLAKIHEARGENELAKEHWKKTANYFSPGNPFHKKAMEYYRRLGGE